MLLLVPEEKYNQCLLTENGADANRVSYNSINWDVNRGCCLFSSTPKWSSAIKTTFGTAKSGLTSESGLIMRPNYIEKSPQKVGLNTVAVLILNFTVFQCMFFSNQYAIFFVTFVLLFCILFTVNKCVGIQSSIWL